MDFGLIGNCQYSALVDKNAKISWLCWPRFDSSPVFGELLDPQAGGFQIVPAGKYTSKQEYVTNTNILKTTFTTAKGAFEVVDFAPRFNLHNRIFNRMMLIRMVRPLHGEVSVKVVCRPTYDYGRVTPTSYWGSNHIQFEGLPNRLRLTLNVPRTYVKEEKPFLLRNSKYFALTWGEPLEAPLAETCENYYRRTQQYWQTWVKHCALPARYQEEVIRSALVLKLHQYEDTGAIVAATTTSIPEAPGSGRTWDYRFCWLRDAYFTLSAFRHLGHFEEMEGFSNYLRNIAESSADQLQPVYSIAGDAELKEEILEHMAGYVGEGPVRIGNDAHTHEQHDIYGEMILAIEPFFMDKRFVLEAGCEPTPLLRKLVDNIEKYLVAEDAGIWEFRQKAQLHTFSLLMHWAGLRKAEEIAHYYHLADLVGKTAKLRTKVENVIESTCWNEKMKCYVQAAGTQSTDASLFMMPNLGYVPSQPERAKQHVTSLATQLTAPHDLIYRYVDHDDFGKTSSAFLVCAFWYVEALMRVGQKKKARKLFKQYAELKNHVGLYSEDIDPQSLQQWGNFPQTYSHVGLINAAFRLFDEE